MREVIFQWKLLHCRRLCACGRVYTNALQLWAVGMGIENTQGSCEGALGFIELFELVGDFVTSGFAGWVDGGSESYGVEGVEQRVHGAVESGLGLGFTPEDGRHQVAQDAHEVMNRDLLVGPMKLGSQREMVGILDVFERVFDVGLSMEGLDDVGGSPVVAVGHQDAEAEGLFEFGEPLVVHGECQLPRAGLRFVERPIDEVFDELVVDQRGDARLDVLSFL